MSMRERVKDILTLVLRILELSEKRSQTHSSKGKEKGDDRARS